VVQVGLFRNLILTFGKLAPRRFGAAMLDPGKKWYGQPRATKKRSQ